MATIRVRRKSNQAEVLIEEHNFNPELHEHLTAAEPAEQEDDAVEEESAEESTTPRRRSRKRST